MNNLFYIGATGLAAQQTAVDTTGHNIANLNTPAFKRGAVTFSTLLTASSVPAPRQEIIATAGLAGGSGVAAETRPVFSPGTLRQSDDAWDLAIRGEGFIELDAADGNVMLWRGGRLRVGDDGTLRASNGLPLKAAISVPRDAEQLDIAPDGQVLAVIPNQAAPLEVGRIEISQASDPRALLALGDGTYRIADDGATVIRSRPGEDNAGTLAQGFGEASNVALADELANLMLYQRAYAASAKLVQAGDELMAIANGLKR
ncbi:flagellar hook-basal body protein [Burkholderia sp. AU31624]|uniref:flagellar hook-basal body protein n=1 Tax=Burkholderia sp. AU31624 TaxID=2879629 RepID=UPI001CF40AD5|nr:flagellar hook-basal body protein [Burkholderia sp. AU31624]MCA8254337.1 flagellar hook-basal body protein [Burkholderia sp. AU31624]